MRMNMDEERIQRQKGLGNFIFDVRVRVQNAVIYAVKSRRSVAKYYQRRRSFATKKRVPLTVIFLWSHKEGNQNVFWALERQASGWMENECDETKKLPSQGIEPWTLRL
jgi:hypothetical protein